MFNRARLAVKLLAIFSLAATASAQDQKPAAKNEKSPLDAFSSPLKKSRG